MSELLPLQARSALLFVISGATFVLKSFYFILPLSVLLAPPGLSRWQYCHSLMVSSPLHFSRLHVPGHPLSHHHRSSEEFEPKKWPLLWGGKLETLSLGFFTVNLFNYLFSSYCSPTPRNLPESVRKTGQKILWASVQNRQTDSPILVNISMPPCRMGCLNSLCSRVLPPHPASWECKGWRIMGRLCFSGTVDHISVSSRLR